MRCIISESSTSISTTASIARPCSFNAFACASVRGKPSKRKPFLQSSSVIRSCTNPRIISSETKPPASITFLASIPSGVPALTAALSMSPVDICGILYCLVINPACVPLPAPGPPSKMTFIENAPLDYEWSIEYR